MVETQIKGKFKLGCNFDFEMIPRVKDLNDKYGHLGSVNEFYGSTREFAYLAARPDFRLPDISREDLSRYVKQSRDNGVLFNYTLNSIHPGNKQFLSAEKQVIIDYVKWLEEIGVHRVTVASPVLFPLIIEAKTSLKIEVSTIAHIDSVSQIKYYRDEYGVDKVCGSLLKNRNVKFLKQASEWCKDNDVQYELMVNEFCGVGGKDYTTHCVFRDSCYIQHAENKTAEDALSLNNYPMENCIWARNTAPESWLKLRFIRPEDLYRYIEIGITNFKITGRTGSTEYILKMAEAYLSREWQGNLLGLWKPLETIHSGESELEFAHDTVIDNTKLDRFLNKWFTDDGFRCEEEVCGETCRYCHQFYSIVGQNKEFH